MIESNWKFWTWAKERRAQAKQIRELTAKLMRQRELLLAAQSGIHHNLPSHSVAMRSLRDRITKELE